MKQSAFGAFLIMISMLIHMTGSVNKREAEEIEKNMMEGRSYKIAEENLLKRIRRKVEETDRKIAKDHSLKDKIEILMKGPAWVIIIASILINAVIVLKEEMYFLSTLMAVAGNLMMRISWLLEIFTNPEHVKIRMTLIITISASLIVSFLMDNEVKERTREAKGRE